MKQVRDKTLLKTVIILLFLILFLLSGCGNGGGEKTGPGEAAVPRESAEKPEIRGELKIAMQYGLAYAPLQILRTTGWLQEELPGVDIQWVTLANTAAIREAMVAGRLDIGFMGIPPFLIGADRGMEWKIFTGLNRAPVGLVTWRSELKSLADFNRNHRIALPQPGSIQHILLSMAAKRELGEAASFDDQLVTMKHPDGMNALSARADVAAHFTSPPFIMEELSQPGNHLVLDGTDAMGEPYTFIVGTVLSEYADANPRIIEGLKRALETSFQQLNEDSPGAVELLKDDYDIPTDRLQSYLDWEGMHYGSEILGLQGFITFMGEEGYLNDPHSYQDYLY